MKLIIASAILSNKILDIFPKEEIIMAVTKEELIQMVKNYKVNTEEVLKYVTDELVRKAVYEDTEKFNNAVELLALCKKDKNTCRDTYYQVVFNPHMNTVFTPIGTKVRVEFIVINAKSTLFMRKCVYEVEYDDKNNIFYMLLTPITNGTKEYSTIVANIKPRLMFSKDHIDSDIVQFIDSSILDHNYDDEYDDHYDAEDQVESDESNPVVDKPSADKRQVVEDPETHKRYYIVPVDEVPPTPPYVYQRPYPTVPGLSDPTIAYGMGPYGYYGPTPITPHFSTGYYTKK